MPEPATTPAVHPAVRAVHAIAQTIVPPVLDAARIRADFEAKPDAQLYALIERATGYADDVRRCEVTDGEAFLLGMLGAITYTAAEVLDGRWGGEAHRADVRSAFGDR